MDREIKNQTVILAVKLAMRVTNMWLIAYPKPQIEKVLQLRTGIRISHNCKAEGGFLTGKN